MNKQNNMKNNKLFNVAGTKERLFEMMQKVNKVALHEGFDNSNDVFSFLDNSWGELESHKLRIDETNTQTNGNESYVEIIGTDRAGTKIRFSFKVTAQQDDQDGVWNINEAELFEFTMGYGDEHGVPVNSDSQAVKNFNSRHQQSAIIDVVSEYTDFESGEPEMNEEDGSYPDPIGKKFKPKSKYPKHKKKPQTTVNIDEENGGDDELGDVLLGYKPKNVGDDIE